MPRYDGDSRDMYVIMHYYAHFLHLLLLMWCHTWNLIWMRNDSTHNKLLWHSKRCGRIAWVSFPYNTRLGRVKFSIKLKKGCNLNALYAKQKRKHQIMKKVVIYFELIYLTTEENKGQKEIVFEHKWKTINREQDAVPQSKSSELYK